MNNADPVVVNEDAQEQQMNDTEGEQEDDGRVRSNILENNSIVENSPLSIIRVDNNNEFSFKGRSRFADEEKED